MEIRRMLMELSRAAAASQSAMRSARLINGRLRTAFVAGLKNSRRKDEVGARNSLNPRAL